MKLAVIKETAPGETRVALVPECVRKLVAAGYTVSVERAAGADAKFADEAYATAGAVIVDDAAAALDGAEMVLKVRPPSTAEVDLVARLQRLPEGCMVLGGLLPLRHLECIRALAAHRLTAFSTDAIPRITRAQSMDTLSSMANIAGYRGALLAALELPRYFPMLMTAAGTILPARVFVIGAGVAGLQAIATAKRLGANVVATDVRPEVREQIESVGAKWAGIELRTSAAAGGGYAKELSDEDKARQRELLAEECARADAVITTALIGGTSAPKLITRDMVSRMKPGAVVIDLAADGGGNCEASEPGRTVEVGAVRVVAPLNLPASMPSDASTLWSRNLLAFISAFTREGRFHLMVDDDILRGAMITHQGEVTHKATRDALAALEERP
ncbi:MAG: Re/Si-specific NAD(P)(+) transhydrogenase subunit alpha [Phycisphaeraceae bacterium]|nr:Re/Si-specific NAD(P)(+) transhydrogenase subunit alpha [Phycisphaeraceae bacterium]